MSDLIDRQAAIDAVEFGITYAKAINKSAGEVKELFKEGNKALNEAVERIKDLPSAQPNRGRWIIAEDIGDCCYRCSNCGFIRDVYVLDIGKYCPQCGVKMEVDDEID